jgi:hypothetical protein
MNVTNEILVSAETSTKEPKKPMENKLASGHTTISKMPIGLRAIL